jgi:hypothetical protein
MQRARVWIEEVAAGRRPAAEWVNKWERCYRLVSGFSGLSAGLT